MENYSSNIIAKTKSAAFILFLAVSLVSCKDIIEEDISEMSVQMIIPTANDTIFTNNVHFKWNELEGADNYRLQVVEPSFSNINTFVLDSLISGTQFYYSLNPGNYAYQLRAENSAYQSLYYGPINFTVDSVTDLAGQIVPLVSPADLLYTNVDNFTANWQTIFSADYYEFQLRSGADFNASGSILESGTLIYGNSYTTSSSSMSAEGEYSWGVRAANQTSLSAFSSRTILVDKTEPNDITLTSPTDAFTTTSDTVVFKWNYGTDPGTGVNSPISYLIEIDDDAGFGSTTDYTTSADSLQVILSTGTYYWRGYALDEAGNISDAYSSTYSVIIP